MIRSVARGFIFTTTQSPAVMAGAIAAIAYQKQHMDSRINLQLIVAAVKKEMAHFDLPVLPNSSHLVPVMVGDARRSQKIADILFEDFGIYVQPINSPTVRVGMERFRVSPTAAHTSEPQQKLIEALVQLWKRFDLRMGSDWVQDGAWTATEAATRPIWTSAQLKAGPGVASPMDNSLTAGNPINSLGDTLLAATMLKDVIQGDERSSLH